jgi:hypothetical protein
MCTLGLIAAILSGAALVLCLIMNSWHFEEIEDIHTHAWKLSRWIAAIGCGSGGE